MYRRIKPKKLNKKQRPFGKYSCCRLGIIGITGVCVTNSYIVIVKKNRTHWVVAVQLLHLLVKYIELHVRGSHTASFTVLHAVAEKVLIRAFAHAHAEAQAVLVLVHDPLHEHVRKLVEVPRHLRRRQRTIGSALVMGGARARGGRRDFGAGRGEAGAGRGGGERGSGERARRGGRAGEAHQRRETWSCRLGLIWTNGLHMCTQLDL